MNISLSEFACICLQNANEILSIVMCNCIIYLYSFGKILLLHFENNQTRWMIIYIFIYFMRFVKNKNRSTQPDFCLFFCRETRRLLPAAFLECAKTAKYLGHEERDKMWRGHIHRQWQCSKSIYLRIDVLFEKVHSKRVSWVCGDRRSVRCIESLANSGRVRNFWFQV